MIYIGGRFWHDRWRNRPNHHRAILSLEVRRAVTLAVIGQVRGSDRRKFAGSL